MKNIRYIYSIILGITLSLAFVACEDELQPIEELQFNRVLAPIGLQAFIRTNTTIELQWALREGVSTYVVEFAEDSLQFANIIYSAEVSANALPYRHTLAGETRYSARVKAVGAEGLEDSKWAMVTIATAPENIFLPLPGENVQDTYATLLWTAGSDVTHFVINPGNTRRDITADEKAAGEATVEGLTGSTSYSLTLYNDTKRRGTLSFSTQREANTFPDDDLVARIASAEEGEVLILAPGEYNTGGITLTKSITLDGQKSYDKPVINGNITVSSAISDIVFKNILFDGGGTISQFFSAQPGADIKTLSIAECEIRNFTNSVIASTNTTASAAKFGSITISGSYIHDFLPATGGDGLDFRGGTLGSLTVQNSTFANGFRSFLRMQVASNVSFKNCTFYKISVGGNLNDSNNTGLFRVSVAESTFEVRNCLFSETGRDDATDPLRGGVWTRSAANMAAPNPVHANNNVFNCANIFGGLYTSASQISATELDPGFESAGDGDLTLTNQTLIDNNIGDPRWFQ